MSAVAILARKLLLLFQDDGATALCGYYTFPMPVQTSEGYHLFQDPTALSLAFTAFVQGQTAHGLLRPKIQIAAIEMPFGHRFRIWADWHFAGSEAVPSRQYRTIYYCSLMGSRAAIEMIQFCGTMTVLQDLRAPERESA